jgi:hypothetical protein
MRPLRPLAVAHFEMGECECEDTQVAGDVVIGDGVLSRALTKTQVRLIARDAQALDVVRGSRSNEPMMRECVELRSDIFCHQTLRLLQCPRLTSHVTGALDRENAPLYPR